MTRRLLVGAWSLALSLAVSACFERPTPTAKTTPEAQKPAAEITLVPLSLAAWKQKLAAYAPKIVVVDLWATWCVSCIERFPKMVEMQRRYRDRNVQFVSLSLDDINDPNAVASALEFLQDVGATFDNYLIQEPMLKAFDALGLIGIPVVLMYDAEGRERVRLSGDDPNKQFSDQDVEIELQRLLAES